EAIIPHPFRRAKLYGAGKWLGPNTTLPAQLNRARKTFKYLKNINYIEMCCELPKQCPFPREDQYRSPRQPRRFSRADPCRTARFLQAARAARSLPIE